MPLESATYIPELTNTNPVGASDQKSEGDDHLRLIKKTILNTFGAFVGTAGTPKSITLTEDELNDCAQKSAAATISALYDFTTQPTISSDLVARENVRRNAQNGNYTLVLGDAGKLIHKISGGGGETITIPANASVAFPIGTVITIVNAGGGNLTVAITTDTMRIDGGGTGSRTLADDGVATLIKVNTTLWFILGGLSLS